MCSNRRRESLSGHGACPEPDEGRPLLRLWSITNDPR